METTALSASAPRGAASAAAARGLPISSPSQEWRVVSEQLGVNTANEESDFEPSRSAQSRKVQSYERLMYKDEICDGLSQEFSQESWNNLLGIYTGLLQDETCNGLSQEFSPCNRKGLNDSEHSQAAAQAATYSVSPQNFKLTGPMSLTHGEHRMHDIHVRETCRSLPDNVNSAHLTEQNQRALSIRTVASGDKIKILNQTESVSPYLKNIRNVIPQKVGTLAELMDANKPPHYPIVNGKPSRSPYVLGNPIIFNSHSQIGNRKVHDSGSSIPQKAPIFYEGQPFDDHNPHQLPNSRLTVPYMVDLNQHLPQNLTGASSSVATPFQFRPATPNQKELMTNYQFMQVPHSFANDVSHQEKDKEDKVVFDQQQEITKRRQNETDNTVGIPSAAILTPAKEKIIYDDRNEGIDLNKTPQQKTPKRKKHRPKVVVEGKLKRTTKPEAPRNETPNKTSTEKRKYERKRTRTSTTPYTDPRTEVEAYNDSAVKSCRRALNFDLEDSVEKVSQSTTIIIQDAEVGNRAQIKERSKVPLNSNSDCHSPEWHRELSGTCASAVKEGFMKENPHKFLNSINHIQPKEPIPPMPTFLPTPSKGHTLNLIARSLNMQGANARQNGLNRYSNINQLMSGDPVQQVMETKTNGTGLEEIRQPNLQTRTQLYLEDMANNQVCMIKNSENQQRQAQFMGFMGTQLWSNADSKRWQDNCNVNKFQQNSSESVKRKKIVDIFNRTSSIMSPGITNVENFTGDMESRECKSLQAHRSVLDLNDGLSNYDNCLHAQRSVLDLNEGLSNYDKCLPAQSSVLDLNDGLSNFNKCFHAHSSALNLNDRLSNYGIKNDSENPNNEATKVMREWFVRSKDLKHNFQQQAILSQVHLCSDQPTGMISNHITQAQNFNSLSAVSNWNLNSATQRGTMARGNVVENYPSHDAVKKQTAGQKSDMFSGIKEVYQPEINCPKGRGRPLKAATESQEHKEKLFSVEYITESMKYLRIYDNGKEDADMEQNALVPYRGDGAIVSYKAFDPIKKRRPRPKVDLDLETTRVWNLLMGKEGESTEPMDSDRQNWWEKERKILCNRADSFIARMHLVQGDRRLSKWKGSVVDSVIGVFLTQNVSDHLSSSAFMSLAAKFPLKPITRTEPFNQIARGPMVEPQRVLITYPDGTTYDYKMMPEPSYNPSSVTFNESSECGAEIFKTGGTDVMNAHARKIEEDMFSSQCSSESIVFQASEDIRSSSGSNSEVEDHITGLNFSKSHGPSTFSEQPERIAACNQCQSQVMESSSADKRSILDRHQFQIPFHGQISGLLTSTNAYAYPFGSTTSHHERSIPLPPDSRPNMSMDLEKSKMDFPEFSGKRTISSSASTDVNFNYGTDVGQEHDIHKQNTGSDFSAQQIGIPEAQTFTENRGIFGKDFEQKTDLSAVLQSRKDFINCRHDRRQDTFQQVVKFMADSIVKPAGSISQMPTENLEHSNTTLEPAEVIQINTSSSPSSKMSSSVLDASKQKADKEKSESIKWDALRKMVQSKAGTRAISRDTMDSMDYEALRNADVHEIAEAIKERGMNNMLAERIKDFLNRLVKDHEKVDLEWLRDVEPDKVKDYLLSIRGLGLKSVECVRLLTLHNVAFPVDTNVGRIAVRLGWVPLRPLPESLQLHLLELYPVLESIQKYLWPRLCHLDQETLYELHYQMITFGKVFCTKRDPNCNACPMRGDCRHFASAYASARLSLPGIEERQIVCSVAPNKANKTCGMITESLPFPLTDDNLGVGAEMTRNSEPIIEEPKTPDPPTQVLDIEDMYHEDPDEIPVIKLNIEEFATNLQNFIQENKEIQGDISKALVVLSPEFASIPVPKLKHSSRLRTEHQVYELPDSHLLLKGLDKREPDDPSPYLLVLWTPGETANSVQPPENKCSSQDGNLCNEQTCFSCSTRREAMAQTVRCTFLIPCRTAMRGSFPLNGTYFQVNEVFADHETSINPIVVPRNLLWNLPRRTVFFGTSVTTIFKGLTTEGIQYCFWKGFVCVRGFDQKTRAPRPLSSRLHEPASKMINKMGNGRSVNL